MAQENLKPLKTLVFSMGVMLLGGTVLLAVLVWKKTASVVPSQHASDCPGGHVDLKGHGAIMHTTVDGQTMRILFRQQKGKSEMVMVDTCSGRITGTLILDSDAAAASE